MRIYDRIGNQAIKINMEPTEKFDRQLLYVLDKVQEQLLLKPESEKAIRYNLFLYPIVNNLTIPHPTTEQRLVNILLKHKVIARIIRKVEFEVDAKENANPQSVGVTYYLKINESVFKDYYEKHRTKIKSYISTSAIHDEKFTRNIYDLPDKLKWFKTKSSPNKGEYEVSPGRRISFGGGVFGGINELIQHTGHEISREQLISAIKRYHQGPRATNISIAKWKYYLMHETEFPNYFELIYRKPHYYQLFLKKKT